jgi:hypothetical protein
MTKDARGARNVARAKASGPAGAARGDPLGSDSAGGESEQERAIVTVPVPPPPLSKWAIKGQLAGKVATAQAHAGREFSVDVPFSVSEAGDEAEVEWLTAFHASFQTPAITPGRPAAQDITNALALPSKKKRKASTEPLVGVTGLMTTQARDVVTKVSTKTVRESFYLPSSDDCKQLVESALFSAGEFSYSEADLDQWWLSNGFQSLKSSAKTCRYDLTRRVKEGIFTSFGTCPARAVVCR